VRTFDHGAVLLDEDWQGYRNWTEASEYYTETDAGSICTPSIGYESYATSGQRKHLLLTINNTSGSTQTARIGFGGIGLGLWAHNTVITTIAVTVSFRYKASAGLAGATASFHIANNPFGITVDATPITADGEWHTVEEEWPMQVDSSLFTGGRLDLTGVTNGMSGTIRFDDLRCVRKGTVQRVIDSTCPVVPLRADWGDGFRETYGWLSSVERADDGSEFRESLRLLPSCRLEYTVLATDPATAGFIEQWLYRYHGAIVAVPRWQDAVKFSNTASSGHEVFALSPDLFTSRWFQARQRFMVWESEDNYEVDIIDSLTTNRITIDPAEGELSGTFTSGVAKIVPLVPGRLVSQIALGRPNGSMGRYPLAFDIQMIQ
jgi:hypothetical protein